MADDGKDTDIGAVYTPLKKKSEFYLHSSREGGMIGNPINTKDLKSLPLNFLTYLYKKDPFKNSDVVLYLADSKTSSRKYSENNLVQIVREGTAVKSYDFLSKDEFDKIRPRFQTMLDTLYPRNIKAKFD